MVTAPVPQQQQQPQFQQPQGTFAPSYPLPTGQPQSIPAQITPSPSLPTNDTTMAFQVATGAQMKHPQDDVMASINQTLRPGLSNMLSHDFGYLQRANSLPAQSKAIVSQVPAQPQPLSAPAMMAMVPGVLNQNFPGLVDAATAASNPPFVVMENQFYPLAGRDHPVATDLIHHVHHPAVGSHHGFVSREAAVTQRFAAAGHMVAGVSSGGM